MGDLQFHHNLVKMVHLKEQDNFPDQSSEHRHTMFSKSIGQVLT